MHPVFYPPAPTLSGAPGIPSSLQPLGTLWDTRALMGVGCPENLGRLSMSHRGQLHRVLAGSRWCGGRGMMVVECGGWCRGGGVGL